MSKRSSRRKRQQKQKKLDVPTLIQQGQTSLQNHDYNGAIKAWERANKKPNAPQTLPAALAEVYFRRGVSGSSSPLDDLQQAVSLSPGDARYRYHLALTHHRQGNLGEAEALYRELLAESPPYQRAATPLAQLLIEQKKPLDKDPVWEQLTLEEQATLVAVEAIFKKNGTSTLEYLDDSPLDPIWRGLISLTLDDRSVAWTHFQAVIDRSPEALSNEQSVVAQGIARYYLGVLAVEAGQPDLALTHWQAAASQGLDSPHFHRNLATLAYEQAVEAQQAGRLQQAAKLLELVPQNGKFDAFRQQLDLELGYRAAQKGNWGQALSHWEKAQHRGDNSRKLIYNLALAYQHQERYREAAEHWRTLLRRRPRKASHPEALTDQQVARIWQATAENYGKAGDYEESIKTFKNAVKWAPENIDLRLSLVEAYQTEGRWQAAENELHRILKKEPDHVPALILLAESYSDNYYYSGSARRIWQRILELEPNNPVARQQLAHSYVTEGLSFAQWGNFKQAIKIFKQGLKQVPDSQHLLVMTGGAYADWGKLKQARNYLEQARAINPNDLPTLSTIYEIWLYNNSTKDLEQTFEHIKAVTTPIPGGFFLNLYQRCFDYNLDKEAEKILAYAEKRYTDDEDVLVGIAVGYSNLEQEERALPILRQVLQKNPEHTEASIHLGIVYHYMGQTRLAKRQWDNAEAQARRKNDQLLLHRIKLVKDEFLHGKPPPSNPLEMLRDLPPEVREQMLKNAPPEVAELLRDIDVDMLEMLFDMGGIGMPGPDDDLFFDFDDEEGEFF